MKKLSMAEWEKHYITGSVTRFDQKYTMGRRDAWDLTIKDRMKDLNAIPAVTDEPGWKLMDWAMRVSTRSLTNKLEVWNMTKPNGNYESINKAFGLNNSQLHPPRGAKLDVTDPVFGADLVGIAPLDRRWIYSHTYNIKESKHQLLEIPEEFKYVIVMGFGSSYDLRKYFPTYINTWTTIGQRQILANAWLSAFIQCLGFKTIDCSFDDLALAIPQAMQAGLGQLGRFGLLVTPEFGANIRLGQIITDIPLIPDKPIDFGVTEFCDACKKCAETCPSHSITHASRSSEPITISNTKDELKWQFNAETCHINLYGYKKPCQICISVCPFTKPNTAFHRTVRWFVDNARWADPFYAKMDELMGYGKPQKADNFWDEWQPEKH
ncbi:MAG: reductive dehalogenase [Chloroflexi bacterium]|nr:reductive dehalogenase [Chloroflexota bacterium]